MKTYVIKKSKELNIIQFLPSCLTFGNALCGFLSILQAIEGHYSKAAVLIGLAACLDLCDGPLARALGIASPFGEQLDSLCDAISFCVAPVIVLYNFFSINTFFVFSLSVYMCAGIFRLARFNISGIRNKHYFVGLSTPVSAFLIASLILYKNWFGIYIPRVLLPSSIAIMVLCIACLMTSNIKFFSGKNLDHVNVNKLFVLSGLIVFLCFFSLYYDFPVIFLVLVLYILSSIVIHSVHAIKRILFD